MRFFGRVWRVTIFRPDGSALEPAAPGSNVNLNPLSMDPLTAYEIPSECRVVFSIEKKLVKNPNTCDLTIYNLSERTRALVKQAPVSVKLEAGYDNVPRMLFIGDIRYADSKLNDTTWETKIQLKDGGRSYKNAFSSFTYSKGTPLRKVIAGLVKDMGFQLPPNVIDGKDFNQQLAKSLTVDEFTRDGLSRVLGRHGYSWSIQNGLVQILKDTEVRDGSSFIVNEDNAMIDTPSYAVPDKKGGKPKMTFKALLWPELMPGAKVDMQARDVRGIHKITELKHTGDSDEVEWYTTCEAKQL